jgi:hypothetical protein
VHAHVGPEPSSAQKRKRPQTDEELADYRQLRKLFKLEKGDSASDVLAPLVEIAPLVCPALHDPATHAPLRSSPRLVEAPGQSRSTGGPVEAQVFKREAAAQMAMEVCGSSQRAAMALVLGFIATTGQAPPMKYIMSISQIDDHVASGVHLTRSKLIARTQAALDSNPGSFSCDLADRKAQGGVRKIQNLRLNHYEFPAEGASTDQNAWGSPVSNVVTCRQMPSKEAKRLADTDLADLADYVPKRMRMTPAAAMCAGTGDNAVGQMAEIRTSARWVAASSAVTVASTRPTPSVPSWASR